MDARIEAIMQMDWDTLERTISGCTACPLYQTATQAVPGGGSRRPDWLFVGEAPGENEDLQGKPFVGQSGRMLDHMLASVDLTRDEIYISNVVKHRPPNNRNPAPFEVQQCLPYLLRQIELLQPKIIVAMGRFAALSLLNSKASLASLRGRVHAYQGIPLVVTYHPAYLLRSPQEKAKAWEDLQLARQTLHAQRQPGMPGQAASPAS